MKLTRLSAALSSAGLTAALVTACGGGGSGGPADNAGPATVDLRTYVVDGPVGNATVCLDKNDNGVCDDSEPTARTLPDGTAILKIDRDDVGKYAVVAEVGEDAVDADHGAVPVAYTLRAPAEYPGLISPLTTLVKVQMDATSSTLSVALRTLEDAASSSLDLLNDYTKGNDADEKANAILARLVVLAQQQSATLLKPAIGMPDSNGIAMSAASVSAAINRRMVDLMPTLLAASRSSDIRKAKRADREALLVAAAQDIVAAELGLTAQTLAVVLGTARNPDAGTPATAAQAAPGANLAWFSFSDAGNWTMRYFASTAAQSTPDANGKQHFTDNRVRAVNGTVQVWGATPAYTRTDAFFDGSAWTVCPTDFEHENTLRDAKGRSDSVYCNAYRSTNVRAVVDIAGKKMADVVNDVRAYPLPSTQGKYPHWGPEPTLLGTAVFPAGAKLIHQTGSQLATPDAYNTLASNTARTFSADIAAGGTPVFVNGMASQACGNVTSVNAASLYNEVSTLEELIAGNPGTPCIFESNANTGPRNEWWSQSTVSVGTLPAPAQANTYYRAVRDIRVAFGKGNSVTYFSCAVRDSDGSRRNCDAIGGGSFSIATVGDARVLRLAGISRETAALTYNRTFVERGGKVYYGYRDKLRTDNALRLNAVGMDALFAQLGISR